MRHAVTDVEARLTALAAVRPTENFEPLAASFKRIQNILKQAEFEPSSCSTSSLLEDGPERDLICRLRARAAMLPRARATRKRLERSRPAPASRPFFDKVLVNAKDERVRTTG